MSAYKKDKNVKFAASISVCMREKLLNFSNVSGLSQSAIVNQALLDYFARYDVVQGIYKALFDIAASDPETFRRIVKDINSILGSSQKK